MGVLRRRLPLDVTTRDRGPGRTFGPVRGPVGTARWRRVRRGWYLGGPAFRQRLVKWLEKAVAGKARKSHAGEARRAHDEAAAEVLLAQGLALMGLKKGDLAALAKGAKEKQVLAWWLRKRTVVSRAWVSRRLQMGDESRVTQAVAAVRRASDRQMAGWRRRLEAETDP